MLVTPHIVEAMNPDQVPLGPGEKWRHPTEAELFWNRDLGGERPGGDGESAAVAAGPPPKFRGSYGFTPPAARELATTENQ